MRENGEQIQLHTLHLRFSQYNLGAAADVFTNTYQEKSHAACMQLAVWVYTYISAV
jgi:hypothetical protein